MEDKVHSYSNDNITVKWSSKTCIHSAVCVNNLPGVFNLDNKPWVNVDGASVDEIKHLIGQCPSGALTYDIKGEESPAAVHAESTSIQAMPNGPLIVDGQFEVTSSSGEKLTTTGKTALCRCGASANKPFCDGQHKQINFEG